MINEQKKKILAICLLAIGTLAVILAIACFGLNVGDRVRLLEYGGDAYTGIQNAGAETANNLMYASKIVKEVGGSILLIDGLALAAAGYAILPGKNEGKPAEAVSDSEEGIEVEITEEAADSNEAEPKMMPVCPACGKETDGGAFCPHCGAKL